jgi:hypothetical protein
MDIHIIFCYSSEIQSCDFHEKSSFHLKVHALNVFKRKLVILCKLLLIMLKNDIQV